MGFSDGFHFRNDEPPIYLSLLQWSCEDECRYECMWKTVKAFHERNWPTPQFYGKVYSNFLQLLFYI